MEIRQITEGKDNYLEMLLIADPQENMIRRYLDKSDMFVLEDAGEVLTIGVVEHMKNKRCELKNLVTAQEYRRQGYGTYMVNYLSEYYSATCDVMYVGTGNNSNTLDFYKQCGFVNSHIVANFFVDHYEKPIYENGIQLTDMIYLKKNLDVVLDVKRVVDMAMHAGRILLKNGGEIFRVEETIKRICGRFHVNHVDIFSMSHGIFVRAENENGEAYTKVNQADSFALNGAFLGYGVNYTELGSASADMAADILVNGADPAATAVRTLDSGIVTVNTETAAAVGIDDSVFKDMCEELKEVKTAEEFE